jgi:hypothetical protein
MDNRMLIPTILHFSLRLDADDAGPELIARVEEALGGRFQEKEYHDISLREMYLLGMIIRFLPWRGIRLKPVYQLTGYTPVPLDYEGDEQLPAINLNQAMIDLLESKGAGRWHIPTRTEIIAEASTEASCAMEGEYPNPPEDWPVEG